MSTGTVLSSAELAEIREAASHYPDPSAASIEALKIVQQHRRWVSDEALVAVAEVLGMSPAELDGVATFYNLIYRKPVGEKVIHYCDSVTCWMLGADKVREQLSERLNIGLGETTADGSFTLLPIVCLGCCDHAPAMMIGPELYGDLDEAAIDTALANDQGVRVSPENERLDRLDRFPHPGPLPEGEGDQGVAARHSHNIENHRG